MIKLQDYYIDPSKVTFISPIDKDIKPHLNAIIYFFLAATSGPSFKLSFHTLEECVQNRDLLLKTLRLLPE